MNLFGWQIRRQKDIDPPVSFAPPQNEDGASLVMTAGYGGAYGTSIDLEGTVKGEADLITKYRQMSIHPELVAAIDEIVNEAIIENSDEESVELVLDDLPVPEQFKNVFQAEFDEIKRLLEFNMKSYHIFKTWYIDGRLYYHAIIDKENPQLGIKELRYIDPRKIKKVREVQKRRAKDMAPVTVTKVTAEYYVFNETGFDSKLSQMAATTTNSGLKIAKDAILYVTSGLLDDTGQMILSHLHQAIRPLNMLRTMEDSAVIYRLVRAPERRVWYIDVGNLPKHKAEQVIYDMMTRHRNKLVYDPATGNIRDQRKHVTMLEDIWLSRREGNRGTQVETLPGSQNLGQMEEVEYFLKKLYKALNVPLSRLEPEVMYSLGRSSEITRDEVKFNKFIERLQSRFSQLFIDLLEKQLILKGFMSPEEWEEIKHHIKFKYAEDNYFAELKEQEVFMQRIQTLSQAMPFVGTYFSHAEVRKKILKQTDEDIEAIGEEIMMERLDPLYQAQTDEEGNPIQLGGGLVMPPSLPGPQRAKKDK